MVQVRCLKKMGRGEGMFVTRRFYRVTAGIPCCRYGV
jgi:hypothetical protein